VRKVFCIIFIKIAVSACQYYEKFFCVAQFWPWGAAINAQFYGLITIGVKSGKLAGEDRGFN